MTVLKIETRSGFRIANLVPQEVHSREVHWKKGRSLPTGCLRRNGCPVWLTLFLVAMVLVSGTATTVTRAAVGARDGHDADPLASLPGLITAGGDRTIKRWDMSGRLASTVGTHDAAVNAIALVPGSGGTKLISVGADGRLKIWNTLTAMELANIDTRHGSVTALALSPDGRLAATGGADAMIRLWNLHDGHLLTEVKAHGDTVRALQFTRNGSGLVSGSADKLIRIWRVGNGGSSLDYLTNILAHDDAVTGLVLTPDDQIASVSADGYLKFWEPNTGSLRNRVRVSTRGVFAIAISPDGKTIATGDEDGKIHLWSAITGAPVAFMGSHDRAVCALAWTPDGMILVSGSEDKTVRYWNVAAGRQVARIAAHDGAVKAIVIVSP